jgi:anti-sigma regulatory factor (Ser/Thr protein kinase)
MRLDLRSDLTELPALAEALERYCDSRGIGPDVASVVNLALEEIVTNLISCGSAEGAGHRLRVELAHDGAALTARIEDDGAAFNPLARADDLVSTLMDEVHYARADGRNVWTIRKLV